MAWVTNSPRVGANASSASQRSDESESREKVMSSTTVRRLAPVTGAAAVVAVIAATVLAQQVGRDSSPTSPAGRPTQAPSYIGTRDFLPTTSGGKVMVGP